MRCDRYDRPAHVERAVEQARVRAAHRVEGAIHELRQPRLVAVLVHEPRAHDRRQRQRDQARHDHRRGERDRELEEQRAGQPALESDRRVDRRERDRHRDDRTLQLARADQRGLDARLALAHVPLDVLDDDDRVVDDQADRQHDRENRQQVEAEAEGEHDDRRADAATPASRPAARAPCAPSP